MIISLREISWLVNSELISDWYLITKSYDSLTIAFSPDSIINWGLRKSKVLHTFCRPKKRFFNWLNTVSTTGRNTLILKFSSVISSLRSPSTSSKIFFANCGRVALYLVDIPHFKHNSFASSTTLSQFSLNFLIDYTNRMRW